MDVNVTYIDNDSFNLEQEIHVLFFNLTELLNQKRALEQKIIMFENAFYNNVHELLNKVLLKRKEKMIDIFLKKQLETQYTRYEKIMSVKNLIPAKASPRTTDFEELLKRKKNEALKLCHPDKVNPIFDEDIKDAIQIVMQAYEEQDLNKIEEIIEKYKHYQYIPTNIFIINDPNHLQEVVDKLQNEINNTNDIINQYKSHLIFNKMEDLLNTDPRLEILKNALLHFIQNLNRTS